ncbi:MAG: arginine ABC transporter permease ArtM [Enterobacteriaceae bacterium]
MWSYMPELLKGLPISLSLTLASLLIALVLSLLCTAVLTLRIPFLTPVIKGYITLFTGTPLLVQIFLIYYGPGQFEFIKQLPWIWELFSNPWFCAMLALALNSTAYSTLLFHGAMRAIPAGQWQSCDALGLSPSQTLRIMLPYAVKRALSSYSNEVVLIFKSTSLAYTITLMDVMGHAKYLYGNEYNVMAFVAAGLIYLAVNALLTLMMRLLEKRALLFEQR